MIFEHGHENKSCSSCRERVNERMRECETARVGECECESVRVRECESERVTFEHRHENKSC